MHCLEEASCTDISEYAFSVSVDNNFDKPWSVYYEDTEYAFCMNSTSIDEDTCRVDVQVGGVKIPNMLIDSGATVNIVDRETWENLKKMHISCKSKKYTGKVFAYGSSMPLPTVGKFETMAKIGENTVLAQFVVIKCRGRPILGRKTAVQLGVL